MWPSILIRVVHGYLHEIRASFAADRGRLFTTSGATSGAGLGTATASASSRPSDVTTVNCGSYVERAAGEQDFQGWSRLVEDFLALGSGNLHGVPLARDADGTVRTFALLSAKSDFGSAHSAARDEVSSECLAFTETWVTATWRLGELMPFVVYRARAREPTHPLVASDFFCHRFFFPIDMMHLLECKGRFLFPIDVMLFVGSKVVVPVAFGSVRMWLLADARLGSNRDNRLMVITSGNALRFMLRGLAPTFCGRSTWTTSRRTAEATCLARFQSRENAAEQRLFFRELVAHFCRSPHVRDRSFSQPSLVAEGPSTVYTRLGGSFGAPSWGHRHRWPFLAGCGESPERKWSLHAAPLLPKPFEVARVRDLCPDFGQACISAGASFRAAPVSMLQFGN